MENDDTERGGDTLSIEEAASAFVKATSDGADEAKPDEMDEAEAQADDELQASDEDEGESEGEDETEGQSDDEDDQEPDSDHGRFVASNGKVRLPDGTVSTVADLIQGNLRDRDYRQKTMTLGEQRRAFEEQSSAFKASEKEVNEQREYLSQLLESLTPQPPNPTTFDANDPVAYLAYMQAKEQHENFVRHAQYIQQQMGLSRQKAEEENQKQRMQRAAEENGALQEKIPALRDPAKLKAFADDILSAGQAAGFSPQELRDSVPYDHRYALVLQKAAKWDRLQASKPKVTEKVQGRPPVQRSGKQLSKDAKKAQRANDAVTRLRQTGSVEDAAAAYLASRRG